MFFGFFFLCCCVLYCTLIEIGVFTAISWIHSDIFQIGSHTQFAACISAHYLTSSSQLGSSLKFMLDHQSSFAKPYFVVQVLLYIGRISPRRSILTGLPGLSDRSFHLFFRQISLHCWIATMLLATEDKRLCTGDDLVVRQWFIGVDPVTPNIKLVI